MNQITHEPIRRIDTFRRPPVWSRDDIGRAAEFVLSQIDRNLDQFTYSYPAAASVHQVYPAIGNVDWTNGFWTGMLWLAYELTGENRYRLAAEIQLKDYGKRAEERIHTDTHDLGFLYSLSCVAACKITGDHESKRFALAAADLLMERYVGKCGIIQAWGALDDPEQQGRMIIDCNLNLPLLYWASDATGNPRYAKAGVPY